MQFLPDHVYCFLPSLLADQGDVRVYDYMPEVVKHFLYCMRINNVEIVNDCSGPPQEVSKTQPDDIKVKLSIPSIENGKFLKIERKRDKRAHQFANLKGNKNFQKMESYQIQEFLRSSVQTDL